MLEMKTADNFKSLHFSGRNKQVNGFGTCRKWCASLYQAALAVLKKRHQIQSMSAGRTRDDIRKELEPY